MIYSYKGYKGVAKYDAEDQIYHGEVVGLRKDTITFQSEDKKKLEKEFQISVDVYLDYCEEKGLTPEPPPKILMVYQ